MERIEKGGFPIYRVRAAVVGSGCAGLSAADWLCAQGVTDICLLTEGMNMGTSRNTGSDKQTYYKLSLSGGDQDSVFDMARTLFQGGGVHGDLALCEAAGSVKAFMRLCGLGVPFPTNDYGEYVGYKTDHDPFRRATSAGPLTSKYMTLALEKSVKERRVPILDRVQVISLLVHGNQIHGLIGLDENGSPVGVLCGAVILCTGGPAGLYERSVYPRSQRGSLGLAAQAGAALENLDLWQYGLASLDFRWNVSGSYQQVIPRYFSVDQSGTERDFLTDALGTDALLYTFLKGYQWPFDANKKDASSLVDILVHEECRLGREVYMDFRTNPEGYTLGELPKEALEYLLNCGSTQPTPFERLLHMNPQAVKLYLDNGIDLKNEPLKIAVCAQHHNGGVAVDLNWQTSVKGLYAAGEAAATFGSVRPGGSALNSTQVGSMRAAEHIAQCQEAPGGAGEGLLLTELEALKKELARLSSKPKGFDEPLFALLRKMSDCAAHLRQKNGIEELLLYCEETLEGFPTLGAGEDLRGYFGAKDAFIAAREVLGAMLCAREAFGSRGSCLYVGAGGAYIPAVPSMEGKLIRSEQGCARVDDVRPLPQTDDWFENVWRKYREKHGL